MVSMPHNPRRSGLGYAKVIRRVITRNVSGKISFRSNITKPLNYPLGSDTQARL
jgi:hypothetical protein